MTPIGTVFQALRLSVVAWALVVGLPRLPALLAPAPGATPTTVHTLVALVAIALVLGGSFLRGRSDFARQFVKNRAAFVGLHVAVLLGLLAAVTPMITAVDPIQLDVGPHLSPPSVAHWLGTDDFGRDGLSRCLYGARISLVIGFVSVAISSTVGTLIGAVAGFWGGAVDRLAMWLTDLLLALPRLVLLLAVVGTLRPEGESRLYFMVALLGATGWMGVARLVRAQVLSMREQDFVLAARAAGVSPAGVLFRHVVPNCLPPVIVLSSLAMGGTMLTEASLSFLGLGVAPPTPTWGTLIHEGRESLRAAPWISMAPGVLIALAVLSFYLIGEGLRDALDPRLRGVSQSGPGAASG